MLIIRKLSSVEHNPQLKDIINHGLLDSLAYQSQLEIEDAFRLDLIWTITNLLSGDT